MTFWQTVFTTIGLALITLLTRSFFLLPRRDLPMPGWLRQGLRYAPLAALVAVIVPEVLLTDGHWGGWPDARLPAVAAATAYYYRRRGILGTIVSGTAVLLALRLGFGW